MVKVISISNGVYDELAKVKGEKSFSQVILELLKKQGASNKESVLAIAGEKNLIDEKKIKTLERDWRRWSGEYA